MTHDEVEQRVRNRWGTAIRDHRQRMNLSQDELRARFTPPVSQSTIQRWETGESEPRIKHRLEMADVFGVDATVLFPLADDEAA